MNFKPTLTKREYYRGDTPLPRTVHFKDTDGQYIDITGYKIWYTVREKPATSIIKNDADAIIHKEIDGDATGIVTFSLSSDDTDIPVGTYYYDFQYKKPDGVIKTLGIGEFVILAEATRSR